MVDFPNPDEAIVEKLVSEILNFNSDELVTVDEVSSVEVNACMQKLAQDHMILLEIQCAVRPMGYQLWYLSNLTYVKVEGKEFTMPVQNNIFAVFHHYQLTNSVVIQPIEMWNSDPSSKGVSITDYSKKGGDRYTFVPIVSTYTAITGKYE